MLVDDLDHLACLTGRFRHVTDLPGGLTNRNLRAVAEDGDYVVRCWGSDAGLLGIDRDAEHVNTRAAFRAGVGAEVVEFRPDLRVMVIRFLPGEVLSDGDFTNPGVMARAALACRTLHAGLPFTGDFDMSVRQAAYLATIRDRGFRLPAGYEDHQPRWDDVCQALATDPRPAVPCNNDLLAANFIDDGSRVWLIDYEYSGNNDPCFELGNTATECSFTPEMTEAWAQAYFGSPTLADLARVRVQAVCSAYGWALWGFIQAATSPLDFDFYAWGEERYEKAAAVLAGPDLDALLQDVVRG